MMAHLRLSFNNEQASDERVSHPQLINTLHQLLPVPNTLAHSIESIPARELKHLLLTFRFGLIRSCPRTQQQSGGGSCGTSTCSGCVVNCRSCVHRFYC